MGLSDPDAVLNNMDEGSGDEEIDSISRALKMCNDKIVLPCDSEELILVSCLMAQFSHKMWTILIRAWPCSALLLHHRIKLFSPHNYCSIVQSSSPLHLFYLQSGFICKPLLTPVKFFKCARKSIFLRYCRCVPLSDAPLLWKLFHSWSALVFVIRTTFGGRIDYFFRFYHVEGLLEINQEPASDRLL